MLTKKLLDSARCMYLYADASAVIVHQKRDPDAGDVEWITVHESIGVTARFKSGRLIVHHVAEIAMVLAADSVNAKAPSYENGSDATKKLGVQVGYIALNFGRGDTFINDMPGVISNGFTYQEDMTGSFAEFKDLSHWSDKRIAAVYPSKSNVTIAA